VTTLRAEPLSAEAFAPFGRIVTRPSEDEHASGPGWRWWAETALLDGDDRPWGVGYLDLQPTALRFDWAERHMRTLEAIVATSGDLLVYVGPPERLDDPESMPPLESFRAFRVPAGSGVVLDRGVWHGAPFAAGGRTSAIVLILEGTGRDDLTLMRFPDTPVAIEISEEKGRGLGNR
jgi:ureidoglycolate lyase